jgi:hypothetical protein
VHRVDVHDRLARTTLRWERDELRVELVRREDPERDGVHRVGADEAGLRDLEHHVRGSAGSKRDCRLRAAVRRRETDLVAVDVKRRDARVAEERARGVPDIAELELVEDVARGAVTGRALPDSRVRRCTASHRRMAGGARRCRRGQGGRGQQNGRAGDADSGSQTPAESCG